MLPMRLLGGNSHGLFRGAQFNPAGLQQGLNESFGVDADDLSGIDEDVFTDENGLIEEIIVTGKRKSASSGLGFSPDFGFGGDQGNPGRSPSRRAGGGRERTGQHSQSMQTTCSRPNLTAALKMGPFVEGTINVDSLEVHFEFNLLAANIPTEGSNYLTQGIGIGVRGLRIGNIPLYLGVDRTSYDGGLTWQPARWFGGSDPLEASREGLAATFALGAGIGGEIKAENLQNFIPCAM